MGWIEFASSALWPLVVLVIVLIFRRPLGHAARNLANIKLPGGVEASFEPDILRIEAKADAVEIESSRRAESGPADQSESSDEQDGADIGSETNRDGIEARSLFLAALSHGGEFGATGLVIHSWQVLEEAIIQLYARAENLGWIDDGSMSPKNRPTMPFNSVFNRLFKAGVIEVRIYDLIDDLRNTRNKVVHSADLSMTRGQALSYAEAASAALDMIRSKERRLEQRSVQ